MKEPRRYWAITFKERYEVVWHVNYVAGLLTGGVWCDPNLSARRNLETIASLFKIPASKVNEVLEFVGLSQVASARVGTFSSGMTARLVVAFGLMRDASIFLMDEPTIGISVETASEIQAYLKNHVQNEVKATILYATNNVVEAEKLCDRVAILNNGKVIACGKPMELIGSLKRSEVIEVRLINLSNKMVELLKQKNDILCIIVNKMIASDGKGPYEEGVDDMQAYPVSSSDFDKFIIVIGSRYVWINFSDAHWMNESMKDIPPRYPSKRYGVSFAIGAVISKMDIGVHQSPPIVFILDDADVVFDIAYSPSLYRQGNIDLVRESQNKWTLDVDAWFTCINEQDFPYGPEYYVQIGFTMTIQTVHRYEFGLRI